MEAFSLMKIIEKSNRYGRTIRDVHMLINGLNTRIFLSKQLKTELLRNNIYINISP